MKCNLRWWLLKTFLYLNYFWTGVLVGNRNKSPLRSAASSWQAMYSDGTQHWPLDGAHYPASARGGGEKREGDWSGWEGSRKMRQVRQGREVQGGKDQRELTYKDENVMMKPITLYAKFKSIYIKMVNYGKYKSIYPHTSDLTILQGIC